MMAKYVLYISAKDCLIERPLPTVQDRKVQINLSEQIPGCVLQLEVYDGQWKLFRGAGQRLRFHNQEVDEWALKVGGVLRMVVNETKLALLVLEMDEELTTFRKYDISGYDQVTIGRGAGHDVQIEDPFISTDHAILRREDGGYVLEDTSKNGTFCNNRRVIRRQRLNRFDVIHTVGFKIVYLGNQIAINKAGSVVCTLRECDPTGTPVAQTRNDTPFSPSPRTVQPLDTSAVDLEAPPKLSSAKQESLLYALGPALTMPIPILVSLLIRWNVNDGQGVRMGNYVAMLVSVLLSAAIGVLWMAVRRRHRTQQECAQREQRDQAYEAYLREKEQFLRNQQERNRAILDSRYPDSQKLIASGRGSGSLLWNRNRNQEDFLTLRLGTGRQPHAGKISIPKESFSMEEDPLAQRPKQLRETYQTMDRAASLLDLSGTKLIGVVGSPEQMCALARTMIVQAAALHTDTDLKIAFLCRPEEVEEYSWVRWLPHTFVNGTKLRLVAGEDLERQNVLYTLTGVLRARQEQEGDQARQQKMQTPHYLIFCTSETLLENEAISSYLVSDKALGVTLVMLYGVMNRFFKECRTVLQANGEQWERVHLDDAGSESNRFTLERVERQEAESFARRLSCLSLLEQEPESSLPDMVDYLELMEIRSLEQWDLVKRYKENRTYEQIAARLGVTAGNRPLVLDLHEKRHGPHGLIAGTTGAGKSEVIQTMLLSLMFNYPPDQLAFVLIDYKGGGMANIFRNVPHLAGTITNLGGSAGEGESLDEAQTKRALISVHSEIKRRQKLFQRYQVNHIDQYTRLYRERTAQEAMPHLLLIADEFAELKREQPDFIKELISAARVGRSLGIHLILATQRPGGVVDDEIWSNARFKICLRVQDRQDSYGMLHRTEAAEITRTGRAYLQIGNDELFELFQAGYSGAPYLPHEDGLRTLLDGVKLIGLDATPCVREKKQAVSDGPSQLSACLEYITEECRANQIPPTRKLWMPPLPNTLTLDALQQEQGTSLSVRFGLTDDPEQQSQYPTQITLPECGNILICGAPGSGKTTLVQTILFSLVSRFGSSALQIYLMDFSGQTLTAFQSVPHCGGVCFLGEEEKVCNLMRLLSEQIEERNRLFAQAGVGNYAGYTAVHPMPLILVVLDGLAALMEQMPGQRESLFSLVREGGRCGIVTVLTANYSNEVHYKLRQNISTSIALQITESISYYDLFGMRPSVVPGAGKGRGLVQENRRLLEFQAALPVSAGIDSERNLQLRQALDQVAARGGPQAPRIPVLPREAPYSAFFAEYGGDADKIPLGYNLLTIRPVFLEQSALFCFAVSGETSRSVGRVLTNIAYAGARKGARLFVTEFGDGIALPEGAHPELVCRDYESVRALLVELRLEFKRRVALRRESEEALKQEVPVYILIDQFTGLAEQIYNPANPEALAPLAELLLQKGKGFGIYFFGGFDSTGSRQAMNRPLCKLFTKEKQGIHLGGHLERQRLFEYQLPVSERVRPQPDNVGHMFPEETKVWIPLEGQGD